MKELNGLQQFVDEMKKTSSLNEKKQIIRKYKDNKFIMKIIRYTYDPYKKYNVTSKNCKKKNNLCHEFYYGDIFCMLSNLDDRVWTGHEAISYVNGFIKNHLKYKDLIFGILDKNIEIRANASVFNKIIPGLVPTFDVALATKYEPRFCDFENEDWYVSRKLDGVRCLAINIDGNIKFYSRQGNEFETLDNVKKDLDNDVFSLMEPNTVYDGEICMMDKDGSEDFQNVMKEIRRKNHTIKKPMFIVFDQLTLEEFNSRKSTRLLSERTMYNFSGDYVNTIEQLKVVDEKHMLELQQIAEECGYEGIMLRKDCGYEGKRSKNLLKVKKFHDAEYIVEDAIMDTMRFIENGKDVERKTLSYITIIHKGNIVRVGSGFSKAQRAKYFNNPRAIIGKTITVIYFEETKNQNGKWSLRFPTIKVVHGKNRTT